MRRAILSGAALAVALGLAFGAYWFQPWKLWTDHRVNDALPAVATLPLPDHSAATPTSHPASPSAKRPVLLARGTLISHEHSTGGRASIVRQPDGSRVLAIADLHTSEGPVVKVWLTDQKVTKDGWHVF